MRRWRGSEKLLLMASLIAAGPSVAQAESGSPPARKTIDARMERAAFEAAYVRDCRAFARRESCELAGDLNGDGKVERVFKIRARKGSKVGIGVAWADGRFSVLGAGARTPHVRTEVWVDSKEERPGEEPLELEGIMTWRLLAPVGDGFAAGPGFRTQSYAAISVVGKGIYVSGEDAAEMLYWDGRGWRWLILGF